MCSQESESSIQVVCHYLKTYESKTLEKERLTLKDLEEAVPLKPDECSNLIKRNFTPKGGGDLSFNILESFLSVLAAQLRKISASPFFRPENLKAALKVERDVRVRLFEALMEVSREFASRSVGGCKEEQAVTLWETSVLSNNRKQTAITMVDRVERMVKWADENHLVVMFQEAYSISALYRELESVPAQVKELFKSQNDPLKNFEELTEEELKEKLRKILLIDSHKQALNFDEQNYVLTPDNILKMVLIIQRIRAGVPVIVMGETGCGKTSLVQYLANICDISLSVLNFHAGVYEKDIVDFTQKQVDYAEKNTESQVWVFFDEINTCDYLGLINDIGCHRILLGKELPPNLVFMAACNPYCLEDPPEA